MLEINTCHKLVLLSEFVAWYLDCSIHIIVIVMRTKFKTSENGGSILVVARYHLNGIYPGYRASVSRTLNVLESKSYL